MADTTAISSSSTTEEPPPPNTATTTKKPLTIGVFGGSFNPIHLGHALLAITVRQTKAVDEVVLVPVYKHAVKRDLLPFADRVAMCQRAVAGNPNVTVSTVEEEVGESNGAMLRGLKSKYPPGTRFLWICGDDFFRWMDKPKGLETLKEVSGLIVQRRLHRSSEGEGADAFHKEPIDEAKVRRVAVQMDLEPVDYVYGELPHFSSTLVRRAPGHWRSFLTSSVVQYLDERPHLLEQLINNLEADAAREQQLLQQQQNKPARAPLHVRSPSTLQSYSIATTVILQGLEVAHALQLERGRTSLRLSMGEQHLPALQRAQQDTDALLQQVLALIIPNVQQLGDAYDEVQALAAELQRVTVWLDWDRRVLAKRAQLLSQRAGPEGWLARWAMVEKFNPRIDVLMDGTRRAMAEILEQEQRGGSPTSSTTSSSASVVPELLLKWCQGKEALGRLRAFVCAGGPTVPALVCHSLPLRERLTQTIDTKDRCIARVLQLEHETSSTAAATAPEALHKMLQHITRFEYKLMGCFASSTPLPLVHRLLLLSRPSRTAVSSGRSLTWKNFSTLPRRPLTFC